MHEDIPTRIMLNKEQASELSIGDKISITVSGVVTGISERMYDQPTADGEKKPKKEKEKYFDLELKKTTISGIEGNSADKEYKKMGGK